MWFKIYCFIIKLFRIKVEGYSNLDFEIEKKERELLSSLSVSLDSAKIEIDLILYNNKHKASLKQVNDINLFVVKKLIRKIDKLLIIKL